MAELIESYHNGHIKFAGVLFAKAARIVRRHVEPQRNLLTGNVTELDFDVIMEIWECSQADF